MIATKLIDTDILIWYIRGNKNAHKYINSLGHFAISSVTYMELVQGIRNKDELRTLKQTLKAWQTMIIQINEEISARASFYVEQYVLSHSMQLADALIASTASSYGMTLHTANDKHYKVVHELDLEVFRP